MKRRMTKLFLATVLLIATAFLPRSGQATTCCANCLNTFETCDDNCHNSACDQGCVNRLGFCGKSCGPGGCPV
ncbi:MAG TPA: hypothetical protein VIE43_22925 [Thermoanaerobaculia bacterium]|jgi:hypothetical protein|nr:hypothetical protein [Thermoanaerobaculia bacterium]